MTENPDPLNTPAQEARLRRLLEFGTSSTAGVMNYGAMIYMERPGDVAFLAPIAPNLRGIEIVSASAPAGDGKDYDIWKGNRILATNLTAAEVFGWLAKKGSYTEAVYRKNAGKWAEEVLLAYGVRPKVRQ